MERREVDLLGSNKIGAIKVANLIANTMYRDEELATEVAWVVVYLCALSNAATSALVKSDLLQVLVERMETSNSLQLLIPVRRNNIDIN